MSIVISFRAVDTKVPLIANQKIQQLLSTGIESFGLWPGAHYRLRYFGQILDHQGDVTAIGITDGDRVDLQRIQRSLPFDKSTPFLLAIALLTFVFGGVVFYISEISEAMMMIFLFSADRASHKWNEIFEWF